MLLWVLILALYGAGVAVTGGNLPVRLKARALAIQGLLNFGMLAFIVTTSDPFLRSYPAPSDGRDLNPLLQDPGLAFHPPFLYLGYVGFSICYSFAIAGLIDGRIDSAWARWVRPWTLIAWCALTIGIAMGSWWAYYVLGWGGWWYWDPVENASFMPWLLGTALIHSLAVVEKREALTRWTVLLAILAFGMSLIGTFLVRSGVLVSVHSFALDPARGVFILGLVGVVIGAGLTLFAFRAHRIVSGTAFAPVSREGALSLNNLLICSGMATVFLGTFYPLFAELTTGTKLSVGPFFFDLVFGIVMAPAVLIMALAPMLAWRRGDLRGTLRRLIPAGVAAILVPALVWAFDMASPPASLFGIVVAIWAAGGVLTDLAGRGQVFRVPFGTTLSRLSHLPAGIWGSSIAHFGVGMLVAGVAVSTGWKQERIEVLQPGGHIEIAGRSVTLVGVTEGDRENYRYQQARLEVTAANGSTRLMTPERREYPVAGSATTNTAIATTWFADLYAALGDGDGKGGWTVRLYWNPLVPWIWTGALIAAIGGMVALGGRRAAIRRDARAAAAVAVR